jgi:hypothetical protein
MRLCLIWGSSSLGLIGNNSQMVLARDSEVTSGKSRLVERAIPEIPGDHSVRRTLLFPASWDLYDHYH